MEIEKRKFINNEAISRTDPVELLQFLAEEYLLQLPEGICSDYDLEQAGVLIGQISNKRSYLNSLVAFLKLKTKLEKLKGKDNSEEYQLMMCRRDAAMDIYNIIDQQYEGLSRMITVYIEEMKELLYLSDKK